MCIVQKSVSVAFFQIQCSCQFKVNIWGEVSFTAISNFRSLILFFILFLFASFGYIGVECPTSPEALKFRPWVTHALNLLVQPVLIHEFWASQAYIFSILVIFLKVHLRCRYLVAKGGGWLGGGLNLRHCHHTNVLKSCANFDWVTSSRAYFILFYFSYVVDRVHLGDWLILSHILYGDNDGYDG